MPETAKTGRKRAVPAGGRTIVIEQFRSGICCNVTHKRVLRSLGFRRLNQRVVRPDNPAVRGMVETIPHLVRIVEE
jgi:large subunit ribosomal protein L30